MLIYEINGSQKSGKSIISKSDQKNIEFSNDQNLLFIQLTKMQEAGSFYLM